MVTELCSPRQCVRRIILAAAEHFGLSASAITGSFTGTGTVLARRTAIWLARKHTRLGWHPLAAIFQKDHATLIEAVAAVERNLGLCNETSELVRAACDAIEMACGLDAERSVAV